MPHLRKKAVSDFQNKDVRMLDISQSTRRTLTLTLTTLSLFLGSCSSSYIYGNRDLASIGPLEHAADKLRAKGVTDEFITLLISEYRDDERTKVLDLNLLGFLKSRPEESERIPYWEIKRVHNFYRQKRKPLAQAEKKFKVSKEVISSLLWVETKHGKDLGTYHVPSAFLSLAQADFPTILDQTFEMARERAQTLTPEIENKIVDRSRRKGDWAVNELVALQEIHQRRLKDLKELTGSFSGAFGMAQFLPSSYLSWAKSNKSVPNLFRAEDAILSVGNYLQSNGWKKDSREAQEAALFHYNNDKDYVNRILRMSNCLKKYDRLVRQNRRPNRGSC